MNNVRLFSEIVSMTGNIPLASTGAGTVTSGWVSMADYRAMGALIQTGTLGASATVDAKIQQAQDSSGTGAKDVTGKAITQIVKATGDNKQAIINVEENDLDIANSFTHVRISLTVGTAASVVGGSLFGVDRRYGKGAAGNAASVVEVV